MKRRTFSDVASIIETSEYEWLADDLLSISAPSAYKGKGQSYRIDDTGAYKNIKLSTEDRVWNDEKSLESDLHDVSNVQL